MNIFFKLLKKSEYLDVVSKVMVQEFGIARKIVIEQLKEFHKKLKNNIVILFEYPYVDKHYRDSYYFYFSTKHKSIKRNSIRLSFFENEISEDDFLNPKSHQKLQDSFLGLITLRPTKRNIIGRNLISPKLFMENNFVLTLSSFSVLINGVKLRIDAFPHCSQDEETLSCAETTVLNIMEYFGSKYSEYSPVLPSRIIKILSTRANERQLPSSGLTVEDISYALKQLGFSPKIYSKKIINNDKDYKNILDIYIESGIPVIGALENANIGHAIIIVGREKLFKNENRNNEFSSHDFSFSQIVNKYVVIDDNHPPYSLVPYDNFTELYNDPIFNNCNLTNIIVPLYPKIYVDAQLIIKFFENIKENILKKFDNYSVRFLLASSRSYKNSITKQSNLNKELKTLIIETAMPKFIWVIEIFDQINYEGKTTKGVLIIDATETNLEMIDHLLFAFLNDKLLVYENEKINYKLIESKDFNIFANNLKGEHNLWKSY